MHRYVQAAHDHADELLDLIDHAERVDLMDPLTEQWDLFLEDLAAEPGPALRLLKMQPKARRVAFERLGVEDRRRIWLQMRYLALRAASLLRDIEAAGWPEGATYRAATLAAARAALQSRGPPSPMDVIGPPPPG